MISSGVRDQFARPQYIKGIRFVIQYSAFDSLFGDALHAGGCGFAGPVGSAHHSDDSHL